MKFTVLFDFVHFGSRNQHFSLSTIIIKFSLYLLPSSLYLYISTYHLKSSLKMLNILENTGFEREVK